MWNSTYAAQWTVAPRISALAGIWGAVLAISLFVPDLVSGSEQQHLPIAAFGTWLLGAAASRSMMTTLLRFEGGAPTWISCGASLSASWPRLGLLPPWWPYSVPKW